MKSFLLLFSSEKRSAYCFRERILQEPLGLLHGAAAREAVAAGLARPLAGGPLAFSLVRLEDGRIVQAGEVSCEALTVRRPWAGIADFPAVMGILNVTPDSFSDGGRHFDPGRAVEAGLAMVAAGAALVDVGGESTRPASVVVPAAEECARVVPVVRALARQGVAVSVDTRNAATMGAVLEAGARVINDISALAHDPDAARVVAEAGCPVVLMHMRGTPQTMTGLAQYHDVAAEVCAELGARVAAALEAGIAPEAIALDPGYGFAKGEAENLALLERQGMLLGFGRALVIGVSRKRFIGRIGGAAEPTARMPGSLAVGLATTLAGAAVLRVHDVAATVQGLRLWRAALGWDTPLTGN
jgi:dihydropteroate synthase